MLWWLPIIALAVVFADFTPGTKTAVVLAVIGFFYARHLSGRIRSIEDSESRKLTVSTKEEKAPLSYRVDLVLQPDWSALLAKLSSDNQQSVDDFVKGLAEDKKLGIKPGQGLYGKSFRFVHFYNGLSQMEQIWSDYHNTFVSEIEVHGKILEGENPLGWVFDVPEGYERSHIRDFLVITPEFLGFHTVLPLPNDVMDEDKLSKIPYRDIIRFLLELYEHNKWGKGAMVAIKTFPREIQAKMTLHDVHYDKSDYEDYGTGLPFEEKLAELSESEQEWCRQTGVEVYDERMRRHTFVTRYFSIRIHLEVFAKLF